MATAATCFNSPILAADDTTRLPQMTVDAQSQKKAAQKKKKDTKKETTAQQNATTGSSDSTAQPSKDANPYATQGAPYKIEHSANTKLTEPLADTARTVTVAPKEVLEDKNVTSLRELVRTMPGLTLGSGEGGNAFGDRVFIRGFDARNDMYVDGVRDSGVSTRETFNAEQVEIIKGPSGSISGRGSTGGALNIVTKQATDQNFYNFESKFDFSDTGVTKRGTFDFNQVVNPNVMFRVNGLVQEGVVAGRDGVYDDRYGGAFSLALKPTKDLKIVIDYSHTTMNSMPDWGVPFDPRTRKPFTESGLDPSTFYGFANRDFMKNTQDIGTVTTTWTIAPNVELSNKTRYGWTVVNYIASLPGSVVLTDPDPSKWTVNVSPQSRYQTNEVMADQTDMTVKFKMLGIKHTLVLGTEFSREKISQDSYTNLTTECSTPGVNGCPNSVSINLFNPDWSAYSLAAPPSLKHTPTKTQVDTKAGYVVDTMNWNDKIIFNIGGRLDNYDITRIPSTVGAATLSREDLLFNWNAGLTYKFLPYANVYGAYATSSNPVGDELDALSDAYGGLAANNAIFAPEQNTSTEVGTKWELMNKKLLLTAALFETTKEHARETITGTTTLADTAAYRIRGYEFGATGNLTDRWSVYGGFVQMWSEMTASQNAGSVGLPLANIAHQSFNLLSKYKLDDHWTVGGQATYKGEILGGTLQANTYAPTTINVGGVNTTSPGIYNTLPAYWTFDLFTECKFDQNWTVKLQGNNILNQTVYDAFYRSNTPFVYLGPGRSVSLTVAAKF